MQTLFSCNPFRLTSAAPTEGKRCATGHCAHKKTEMNYLKVLMTVSRVALAVIAFSADSFMFMVTLIPGIIVGAGYTLHSLYHHKPIPSDVDVVSTCSTTFAETFAGIEPHPLVALAGSVFFVWEHIHHGCPENIAMAGGYFGFWVGRHAMAQVCPTSLFENTAPKPPSKPASGVFSWFATA